MIYGKRRIEGSKFLSEILDFEFYWKKTDSYRILNIYPINETDKMSRTVSVNLADNAFDKRLVCMCVYVMLKGDYVSIRTKLLQEMDTNLTIKVWFTA